MADESKRRPSSGRIVSAGPECKVLREGQSVLYSNFAGHVIDLARAGQPLVIRILHETEVLCQLEGHLTMRTVRDKHELVGV